MRSRLLHTATGNNQPTSPWNRCMNLIKHCTTIQQFKPIHAIFITHGFHHNNYALSKLISFCALSNNLNYASLLFHQTPNPNSFIYNTLIRAYSNTSQPHLSLHYFHLMLNSNHNNIAPDHCTFPFVLIACTNARDFFPGKAIHCWVLKNGLGYSDRHIQTALLRFYVEYSNGLRDARKVFDEIPQRDVVHWNVFIKGYLRHGLSSHGLNVFRELLRSDVEPDEYCVTTGLTACAHSGALQQGMWVHEYVKKRDRFCDDVFVCTALVDMYAKCGCIEKAVEVFEGMRYRNVFSWAAMIGGFAVHGFAKEALCCLDRMVKEDGLWPDGVVILAVMMACTHAGFEKEGCFLLENMYALYGIMPGHEHYSCTVDLLCRAGRLNVALELIEKMPMKPLASVWGSMLSACKIHGNVEVAELAVDKLLQLEHDNGAEEDGVYVQLSNIYLNAQRCDEAKRVRKMMGDRGIRKTPGCSVVEVNGKVNEFVAGDVVHHLQPQICATLNLLSWHISDQPYEMVEVFQLYSLEPFT